MPEFTIASVRKGRYPAPVYEAHFADGTCHRMSFWSPAGKPVDLARGRRVLELSTGKPVVLGIVEAGGVEIARDVPGVHRPAQRVWPSIRRDKISGDFHDMAAAFCLVSAAKLPTARPVAHEADAGRRKPQAIPAALRAAIEAGDLDAARALIAA